MRMARYAGRYSFAVDQEALLQAQSPEVKTGVATGVETGVVTG